MVLNTMIEDILTVPFETTVLGSVCRSTAST